MTHLQHPLLTSVDVLEMVIGCHTFWSNSLFDPMEGNLQTVSSRFAWQIHACLECRPISVSFRWEGDSYVDRGCHCSKIWVRWKRGLRVLCCGGQCLIGQDHIVIWHKRVAEMSEHRACDIEEKAKRATELLVRAEDCKAVSCLAWAEATDIKLWISLFFSVISDFRQWISTFRREYIIVHFLRSSMLPATMSMASVDMYAMKSTICVVSQLF